jgi:type II secretion system protein H
MTGPRSRKLRNHGGGFTLLELVLVMMIITTLLAIAAPSMRGWAAGTKLRNAADEFVSLARYARTQAVTSGNVYLIQVNASAGTYQLRMVEAGQVVDVPNRFGQLRSIPDGARLEMTRQTPVGATSAFAGTQQQQQTGGVTGSQDNIEFYPTGRTQPAKLRISDDRGGYDIECPSPTEDFRLVLEERAS